VRFVDEVAILIHAAELGIDAVVVRDIVAMRHRFWWGFGEWPSRELEFLSPPLQG
jgi:hypothetical protein